MPDFTVIRYGTDPNGRPIYMTRYMAAWWRRVCNELGFKPTIVQGAFMVKAGGGASASAGYHDWAGCLDLRVWNLTDAQVVRVIRACRRLGAAAWLRDHRHGMDPHIHLLLGTDRPLASGAAWQWTEYRGGRDGLSTRGRDYHWRPDPLVTEPPEEEDKMTPAQEKKLDALAAEFRSFREEFRKVRGNTWRRDTALRDLIRRKFKATDAQLDEIEAELEAHTKRER